jgi:acyl-CoA thioesterase-1
MQIRNSFSCIALALILILTCSFSLESMAQEDSKSTPNRKRAARQKQDQAKQKKARPKQKPKGPMAPIEEVEGLPRVLLIGDSISIGYTLPVRAALKGKVNVHRPPTNCGPTIKGLKEIDQWLGDKQWDVIHFNWGLHDLKYLGPNGENLQDPQDPQNHQQVSPEDYEKNLRKLVQRLKKTGAKLIWRNTTPVPKGSRGRVAGDAVKYNEIAAKIMKQNGIPIHDVYGMVKPKMAELMLPKGNVHFTNQGSQAIADDVAAEILKALGS